MLIGVTPKGAEVATELRERLENLEEEIAGQVAKRDMAGFEAVMHALGEVTQVDLRAEAREEA